MSDVLETDRNFFNLFKDFKGYVDFFFLQDCVSSDYKSVNIWYGKGDFEENPLPNTVDDYMDFLNKEMVFLEKRNCRIKKYCEEHGM